jgi:outer membrane protein assembly factor BamE (lipoprotein component of BamABCDE complex)
MPIIGSSAYSHPRLRGLVIVAVATATLAGCVGGGMPKLGQLGETTEHGYVVSPMALEQVPVGSSKDQVLIALGTPSTTGNFEGEVYYYISQTRKRSVQFVNAKVVDQKILAVYFDKDEKVERIAQYGIQDGKVFDFVSRTTPTAGKDLNFIQQMLQGAGPNPRNAFGGR